MARPSVDQMIDDLVHLPPVAIEDALRHQGIFVLDRELDRSSPLGFHNFVAQGAPKNGLTRLVQVEVPAIPSLLAHLRDPRKTQFQLRGAQFSPLQPTEYFDWGRRAGVQGYPVTANPFTVDLDILRFVKSYDVTVGDLCYFVLGQITNRCYLPTYAWNFLATPNLYPRLARFAAQEWGKCTRRSLLRSLERDVLSPLTPGRDAQAIRRLKFYYPTKVEGIVLRLLKDIKARANGKVAEPFREGIHPAYSITLVGAFSDIRSPAIDKQCLELLRLIRSGSKVGITRWDSFSIPCIQRFERGTPEQRQVCREFCEARIAARPSMAQPFYHLLRLLNRQPTLISRNQLNEVRVEQCRLEERR